MTDQPELPGPPDVLRGWLDDNGIDFDEVVAETGEHSFSFALPGEQKLQTPIRLDLGRHALGVHAFVCRRPDENHEAVYRWLLERNMRLYGVAFGLDRDGDVYLDARLPLALVDAAELDRLLGSVLSYSDGSFNTLLELGFASSIRRSGRGGSSEGSRRRTSPRSSPSARRIDWLKDVSACGAKRRSEGGLGAKRPSSEGNAGDAPLPSFTGRACSPGLVR